jgi:hypothetical protein
LKTVHTHLKISQRRLIEQMLKEEQSMAAIARAIGVHRSTIKREVDRLGKENYCALTADLKAQTRRIIGGRKANKWGSFPMPDRHLRKKYAKKSCKKRKSKLRFHLITKMAKARRYWREARDRKPMSFSQIQRRKERLKKRRRNHRIEKLLRSYRSPFYWMKYPKVWTPGKKKKVRILSLSEKFDREYFKKYGRMGLSEKFDREFAKKYGKLGLSAKFDRAYKKKYGTIGLSEKFDREYQKKYGKLGLSEKFDREYQKKFGKQNLSGQWDKKVKKELGNWRSKDQKGKGFRKLNSKAGRQRNNKPSKTHYYNPATTNSDSNKENSLKSVSEIKGGRASIIYTKSEEALAVWNRDIKQLEVFALAPRGGPLILLVCYEKEAEPGFIIHYLLEIQNEIINPLQFVSYLQELPSYQLTVFAVLSAGKKEALRLFKKLSILLQLGGCRWVNPGGRPI